MNGLGLVSAKKLIGLEFPDRETFRKAARIAAEKKIPVDAPGRKTLVIKKTDKKYFKHLLFTERRIAIPEMLSQNELVLLRKKYERLPK
ncbi:MAG: hypothetical protein A2934_03495 [Candidatus Sungbacteria bacterium RIFCSPLOWO2_01_FULL_47_10]|uniref:Uncharacterized protein n=1 Tax=Candidatus Sungbacteria bacterium RIFCSPLOWO2_01_FULL_47_10 TaxID=1802276 RepID=A0A1G2L3Y6_9BACT|nr:MAG: hypothetical protein A2934_03495 [Candidatus Sungbacteria bacterium RIFCSPLOWO2_01_FULL_47_10]